MERQPSWNPTMAGGYQFAPTSRAASQAAWAGSQRPQQSGGLLGMPAGMFSPGYQQANEEMKQQAPMSASQMQQRPPIPQQMQQPMGGGQDWASRYNYGAHMQPQMPQQLQQRQQQPMRQMPVSASQANQQMRQGPSQSALQQQMMARQFGGMAQQSPYSLGMGSQQMMQRPQFGAQYGGGGGYGMPQRQQYGYTGPQGRGPNIQGTARNYQFNGNPQDIFLGM